MSHQTNRRRFLQTTVGSSLGVLAGDAVSAQEAKKLGETGGISNPTSATRGIPESNGVATKFWIDPGIAAWPSGPMRKVHIEYHTSRHMPRLAEKFNADEFADQLVKAHVTGATVFAKD